MPLFSPTISTIKVTFDGGGYVLPTSLVIWTPVVKAGTISSVSLSSYDTGSVVVGISKCAGSAFPGSLSSIVASAPPTLTSANWYKDMVLTAWTKSLAVDDVVYFTITSCSGITRLVVQLGITTS